MESAESFMPDDDYDDDDDDDDVDDDDDDDDDDVEMAFRTARMYVSL
jgi:hypothetical protein